MAVSKAWQQEYDTPLRVVVGDHVLSATISSYVPERPSMLIRGDYAISPWLTPAQVAATGAAVVCRAAEACFPALTDGSGSPRRLRVDGQEFVLFLLAPQAAAR
jgi:hypothetical protein